MYQRYLFYIVLLYFFSAPGKAVAQDRAVSGTIVDPRGNALPGINVAVKGTTTGTMSDTTGHYSVSVPEGASTLVFSFIGYATREVKIGSRSIVDVTLEEDVIVDYEVVATALNIPRDIRALQSSMTQIGGENFTQARELNIAAPLEGRVAGVNVTKIASGPAGSTRVVIRGAKSFTGSNQPLYVIDGIPMDNANFGQSGEWGGPDSGDGLNSMSPDDIQSMIVLKGAASTALYGARGGDGVILITTKKSSARKGIGIEFNSNFVAESVINYTDFQKDYGAGGYVGTTLTNAVATKAAVLSSSTEPDLTTAFNAGWNSAGWGPKFDGTNVVQPDTVVRKYNYAGNNWKRFYNTGTTRTNNIALTGGSRILNFRFSYTNLKNNGVLPNSGFNRDNIVLSTNSVFAERLTFVSKVMYSHEDVRNRPVISDSPGNAVQSIYFIPGDQNVTLYKGDPNKLGAVPPGMITPDDKSTGEEFQATGNLWGQNPYWATHQFINSDVRDRINAAANLRYDLTPFVYVSGQVGIDWYTKKMKNETPPGTGYQREGFHSDSKTRVHEVNWQGILGVNKSFSKFRANAFLGVNSMRTSYDTFGHSSVGYNISSLFGSSEISYHDFLYLTTTARRDAFLLDVKENHVIYPAVGTSFVFSDAFKTMPAFLSFGKLRASYAQVGNVSALAPFAVANTQGGLHYFNHFETTSSIVFPNRDLKPSIISELEFGVEVRFLENRIEMDFTYYSQKANNDIMYLAIPQASGLGSTPVNVGSMRNRGVEVLITGTPVRGSLTWDISLNFARNINKVTSLFSGQSLGDEEPRTRTVRIQHMLGQPFGMITGRVQSKTPDGRLIYNSDGAPLTNGNYVVLGNGVHKFTGGLNNSIRYKWFNLDFLIDFKYGGQIYSGTNVRMTEAGYTKQTLQGRAGEAPLTITGTTQTADGNGNAVYTDVSRTLSPGEARNHWDFFGEVAEDKFVYDASFIKLRQVVFGYTIPRSILSKTPFRTLTFSLVARNLAMLYKKTPNIDPESSYTSSNAQGLDYFGMPPTRTYGFNLKVTY